MSWFSSNEPDSTAANRLRAIERKLDAILEHLGIDSTSPGDEKFEDVRQLAATGRKIEAIKLYRERTGADLTTAKAFVDSLDGALPGDER